jgi:3-hydroxyacyl-CoA dehydrogenase
MLSTVEVQHNVSDPAEKAMYTHPEFLQKMLDKNLLGNKTKGGFYKRVGKEKQVIDLNTFEYGPFVKPDLASLAAAKAAKGVPAKVTAFFEAMIKCSVCLETFIRSVPLCSFQDSGSIRRCSQHGPCSELGLQHQMGPFQLFSALDLPKYIARMKLKAWLFLPGSMKCWPLHHILLQDRSWC